ncbi:MAG: polysaccharide deacetylase family protein [Clostridiaceae bacterium]|nr:polysaccharide deacetylase family protein [Clostridiaceae bacterium]
MKKFVSAVLVMAALILLLAPAYAAPEAEDIKILYEGREVNLSHGIEAVDGAAAAALSDVVDMIGAQCSFEPSSKRVTLRFGRHSLRMAVGSAYAHVNGSEFEMRLPVFCKNGTIYVPVEDVVSSLRMGYYTDAETKTVYITRGAGREVVPEDVKVPVLMYHAVSDNTWGAADLFVSPSEMEKQLAYLQENGYTTITFEDLPRIDEIEKPILLTFDDGYRDNYTELFPLLQKYEAKATVFVITDAIGNDLYLTADMIAEMSESGLVSIQSHTDTHPDLSTLNETDTRREMADSQLKLMRITGKQPFVLCYPTGKYSDTTLKALGDYYVYGLKMNGGMHNTSDDPFRINRIYISRYTDLTAFASKIKT